MEGCVLCSDNLIKDVFKGTNRKLSVEHIPLRNITNPKCQPVGQFY